MSQQRLQVVLTIVGALVALGIAVALFGINDLRNEEPLFQKWIDLLVTGFGLALIVIAVICLGTLLVRIKKSAPPEGPLGTLLEGFNRSVEAVSSFAKLLESREEGNPVLDIPLDNKYEFARLGGILSKLVEIGVGQQSIPDQLREYASDPNPQAWEIVLSDLTDVVTRVSILQEVLAEYDGSFLAYRLDDFRDLATNLRNRQEVASGLIERPITKSDLKTLLGLADKYEDLMRRRCQLETKLAEYMKVLDLNTDSNSQPFKTVFSGFEYGIWRYLNSQLDEFIGELRAASEWYLLPGRTLECAIAFRSHDTARAAMKKGWPLYDLLAQLAEEIEPEELPAFVVDGTWLVITFPDGSLQPLSELLVAETGPREN